MKLFLLLIIFCSFSFSPQKRRDALVGKSLFEKNWVSSPASVTSRQGLGPHFNARSCLACHGGSGGRAQDLDPGLVFHLSRQQLNMGEKGPMAVSGYGEQLNTQANEGVQREGEVKIHSREFFIQYPDGERRQLNQPSYQFLLLAHGPFPDHTQFSPRLAPKLLGLGALMAIREKDLLAAADPTDKDGDGISGRPNWVWDREQKKTSLGRFGWKATHPTLAQQIAAALFHDLGITSTLFAQGEKVEIDDTLRSKIETFLTSTPIPPKAERFPPNLQRGQKLFEQIQCSSCHTPQQTTANKQVIWPYTDLLLHDMGDDLADHRPEFLANGREWRTPPLWGQNLKVDGLHSSVFYLHDGRARSLEEAILWHGGEGKKSQQAFLALSKDQRLALLQFLESL